MTKLLKDKMCERSYCDLCQELNELAEMIKKRGKSTNEIENKLGRLFSH